MIMQVLQLSYGSIVIKLSGCGLRNAMRHRNERNKNKLALYKPLVSLKELFK